MISAASTPSRKVMIKPEASSVPSQKIATQLQLEIYLKDICAAAGRQTRRAVSQSFEEPQRFFQLREHFSSAWNSEE